MASPHVAGAAALYLSANRGASPAQVEAALLSLAATGKVGKLPPNTPDRLINVQGIPVAPTPATNLPPVASFTVTCVTTISPHKCTLDAAPSSDDGGFGSLKFSWTNTGGRPAKSGNPISYSYWGGGALNTFAVTLTATDAGNLSHSVTKTVVIP